LTTSGRLRPDLARSSHWSARCRIAARHVFRHSTIAAPTVISWLAARRVDGECSLRAMLFNSWCSRFCTPDPSTPSNCDRIPASYASRTVAGGVLRASPAERWGDPCGHLLHSRQSCPSGSGRERHRLSVWMDDRLGRVSGGADL